MLKLLKKSGETVKTAVHDFIGGQTYTEFPGHRFLLNATFAEIRAEDYDALVIPGGRAPEYLRLNQQVLEITRHFTEANKPIAAGARLGTVNETFSNAETDGNLVTAPAWPAHPDWMRQFLKLLGSTIEP